MGINSKKLRGLLYLAARNLTFVYVLALVLQAVNIMPIGVYINMDIFIIITGCLVFAALFVNLEYEKNLFVGKVVNIAFRISLILLLLILLAQRFFEFDFSYFPYLLGFVIGFGTLSLLQPFKKFGYGFSAFVTILSVLIIFLITRSIGWRGYLITFVSFLLIVLFINMTQFTPENN